MRIRPLGYWKREVDPTTWQVLPEGPGEPTQTWTTYLGDMPWADFTVDADWNPTKVRDYLTGKGLHAQIDAATGDVEFLHGDLIGSTMLRTDDSGEPVSGVSGITYTAFGEPVVNTGSGWQVSGALPEGYPRYAYAGQSGYESDLLTVQGANETLAPVTLAHVGWRWYQAGIGRFVQRDPIGIRGGLNVYAYARSAPSFQVDPDGTDIRGFIKGIGRLIRRIFGGGKKAGNGIKPQPVVLRPNKTGVGDPWVPSYAALNGVWETLNCLLPNPFLLTDEYLEANFGPIGGYDPYGGLIGGGSRPLAI